ncbi:hypothetical protein [Saccharothrix syringae]|uniref:hypothetical protein n=1 Tax=Saccharothrix syringae TaxID=103733 RepID=UPI000AE8B6EF|nr:hypothetical protein [Saccharothrix syringae]
MTEPQRDNEDVERGAAEEGADAPLTDTERELSRRAPSDTPENGPDDGSDDPRPV